MGGQECGGVTMPMPGMTFADLFTARAVTRRETKTAAINLWERIHIM